MRKLRELQENAEYHVTARINRKEFILEEDKFKELFLEVIERAMNKYVFRIINFCIPQNHVHLIIQPGEKESLSRIMQWILSVFAKYYNFIMGINGHVWYDRFKSKIIKGVKQMIDTFKYINENPVKAKLVNDASEFKYSGIGFVHRGIYRIINQLPDYLANLF